MSLEKYWQKRDFKKTPEPRGKVTRPGRQLNYYIQEHHASRLHYDFRLELEGTLKSWAVPKGPSLDPADKRLAVHVEDHPLSYGTFEGDIPEHQYGAGHVKLWDRGVWEPEGDPSKDYKAGRLKFHLDGRKLHGGWTLVRMGRQEGKQDNWLLIKENDDEARHGDAAHITELRPESVADKPQGRQKKVAETRSGKSKKPAKRTARGVSANEIGGALASDMPEMIRPQLATLAEHAPKGDEWLSEVKFDGYRAVCRIEDGEANIYTRAGNDWTSKWKAIAKALGELPVESAWVDGEVVAVESDGKISFQALQNMMREGKAAQLAYYIFDLMYLNGYDLTAVPLIERKRLLTEIMDQAPEGGPLLFSDHITGGAREVFEHACMHGLEGIVVKRADAAYLQVRGRSWLKVKCMQRQEFVVAGYTDPAGSREEFGALLLGVYNGDKLQYCGKVGTGFGSELLREVAKKFKTLELAKPSFDNPPTGSEARGVHWLKPELVAEVDFAQWTNGGNIRHASFVGLRADKSAREIVRERAISDKEVAEVEQNAKAKPPIKSSAGRATVAGVALTHPDKILFPRIGLTKLALAEYYESVADWLLPHLKDRPLALVRCPQGDGHKCFFQKHVDESVTDAIERIEVPEENGTDIYMMANSLSAVIGLVQMGVLELHTWGSREGSLMQPDRMIFDLDPAEGLGWETVVEGAQLMHGLLDEIGLRSFLKTTGGKGLHIVVPLKPERHWDEVKAFSKTVAEHLARTLPDRFTSNMAKNKRGGKIFIDYLRNGRGATAVAAFSTRAKPNATISVPIFWEELDKDVRADTFHVRNLQQRLSELKDDPWKDYWKLKQKITDEMLNLFDKR
jgi:bifunctional non-homologous end joining protein LigD